jgi:hypothetical protein
MRLLEAQEAAIAHLQQKRRDEDQTQTTLLRHLVELQRLLRNDAGLTKPARHTRARPLGVQ